jgi:hypothetical protein
MVFPTDQPTLVLISGFFSIFWSKSMWLASQDKFSIYWWQFFEKFSKNFSKKEQRDELLGAIKKWWKISSIELSLNF